MKEQLNVLISAIEAGKQRATLYSALEIAEAFGLKINVFESVFPQFGRSTPAMLTLFFDGGQKS